MTRYFGGLVKSSFGLPHNLRKYKSDSALTIPGGSLSAPRGFDGTQIFFDVALAELLLLSIGCCKGVEPEGTELVYSVYLISMVVRMPDDILNFVNDNFGKDNPIKKPKTTPTNVVTISLMLSFGFLLTVLRVKIPILFKNSSELYIHNKLWAIQIARAFEH